MLIRGTLQTGFSYFGFAHFHMRTQYTGYLLYMTAVVFFTCRYAFLWRSLNGLRLYDERAGRKWQPMVVICHMPLHNSYCLLPNSLWVLETEMFLSLSLFVPSMLTFLNSSGKYVYHML